MEDGLGEAKVMAIIPSFHSCRQGVCSTQGGLLGNMKLMSHGMHLPRAGMMAIVA